MDRIPYRASVLLACAGLLGSGVAAGAVTRGQTAVDTAVPQPDLVAQWASTNAAIAVTFDPATARFHVLLPRGATYTDAPPALVVHVSQFAPEDFDHARTVILAWISSTPLTSGFAFGIDAATDSIRVVTDATEAQLAPLREQLGAILTVQAGSVGPAPVPWPSLQNAVMLVGRRGAFSVTLMSANTANARRVVVSVKRRALSSADVKALQTRFTVTCRTRQGTFAGRATLRRGTSRKAVALRSVTTKVTARPVCRITAKRFTPRVVPVSPVVPA